MPNHDFSQVQAVLIDPEGNTRRLLRGILARMGVDKTQEYGTVAEAAAAFGSTMPDLLFVDADGNDNETLKFVASLRNSQIATNPFTCVIAMTWEPTGQLLRRFGSSGADDLMMKPFSTKGVQDRIVNLIESRRKFVVTSDYVGPDRRKSPREGQQIPLVDVPNTLRLKAMGEYHKANIGELISQALDAINRQKVVRQGFQVAFLVEFALPGLLDEPPDRLAVDHLFRVPGVVDDLMRRIHAPEMRQDAERYARALLRQIDVFRADPGNPVAEPTAIRRVAVGLAAATALRTDLEALEQEVLGAVTAYRVRLDQIAQSKAAEARSAEERTGEAAASARSATD